MARKSEGIIEEIKGFNKFKQINLLASLGLILFFFLPWVRHTEVFETSFLGIHINTFLDVIPQFNYDVFGLPNENATILIYAIPIFAIINIIISLELITWGNEKVMSAFTGGYTLLVFFLFLDVTSYQAITPEVLPYIGVGIYLMVIAAVIMCLYAAKGPSKKRYHG